VSAPRAQVREVNGQLVLDDPDALAVIDAIGKLNCRKTLELHAERVRHLARRIIERGQTGRDLVVVVINVDDQIGRHLTEMLMPGQEAMWAEMRARGETPYARGLAGREGLEAVVETLDPECCARLVAMSAAVIVVDHGTVEAFALEDE
jgi:hypothetical protein